ncbi:MAG: TRAP transporter substrate-binding protein DctP [Hyphomicrobiales bacterium]|nr:TRAP transporter substrate-binding protein DctP [Hyphomicrobiales bacterium]MCP5372069.1 TRAP transporter substrate-binding protein DctP [Hyphomicrobiales bacterium]
MMGEFLVSRRLAFGAAVAAALAALVPQESQAAEFNFRMQSNVPPGAAPYIALEQEFVNGIRKMTGGRVEIQLFPGGALYPAGETLDAVANGVTELGMSTGFYYAGKIGPIASIESGLPGAEHDPMERNGFFYEKGFIDIAREVYGKHGVYYLAPNLASPWEIVSTVPIHGAKDFKGIKMRAGGIEAEWYNAMGAESVWIGGGELYTALATKVVDAVRWGDETQNLAKGLQEVAKYYIKPAPMPAPNNHILVNMDTWKSLPADIQAIMDAAARMASMKYITLTRAEQAVARAKLEKAGMEFITIPADEWLSMEKQVRSIWAKYAEKGATEAKAVKMLQDYLAELGR